MRGSPLSRARWPVTAARPTPRSAGLTRVPRRCLDFCRNPEKTVGARVGVGEEQSSACVPNNPRPTVVPVLGGRRRCCVEPVSPLRAISPSALLSLLDANNIEGLQLVAAAAKRLNAVFVQDEDDSLIRPRTFFTQTCWTPPAFPYVFVPYAVPSFHGVRRDVRVSKKHHPVSHSSP